MPFRRFVVTILHPALLLAGSVLAVSGIAVAAQRYNAELMSNGANWWRFSGWYVLSHAGTGIALLLMTLAYGAAYWKRPLRIGAPLAYIISYGLCGMTFLVVLESVGKASRLSDAEYSLLFGSSLFIVPALLISATGLLWTIKRSTVR